MAAQESADSEPTIASDSQSTMPDSFVLLVPPDGPITYQGPYTFGCCGDVLGRAMHLPNGQSPMLDTFVCCREGRSIAVIVAVHMAIDVDTAIMSRWRPNPRASDLSGLDGVLGPVVFACSPGPRDNGGGNDDDGSDDNPNNVAQDSESAAIDPETRVRLGAQIFEGISAMPRMRHVPPRAPPVEVIFLGGDAASDGPS